MLPLCSPPCQNPFECHSCEEGLDPGSKPASDADPGSRPVGLNRTGTEAGAYRSQEGASPCAPYTCADTIPVALLVISSAAIPRRTRDPYINVDGSASHTVVFRESDRKRCFAKTLFPDSRFSFSSPGLRAKCESFSKKLHQK